MLEMLETTYVEIFTFLQYALKQRQVADNIKSILKQTDEVDGYQIICFKYAHLLPETAVAILRHYGADKVNAVLMEILKAEKKWPCQ